MEKAAAQARSPAAHAATSGGKPGAGKDVKKPTLAERNVNDLAQVLYDEARGTGDLGMTAVGSVLKNRMTRNGTGSVRDVWGQFSHLPGKVVTAPDDKVAMSKAKQIAADVLDGKTADPTGGATHYYSPQRMTEEQKPKNADTRGGKEVVAGVTSLSTGLPTYNYMPGDVKSPDYMPMSVPGLADRDYKFYRKQDGGHVN